MEITGIVPLRIKYAFPNCGNFFITISHLVYILSYYCEECAL
jgi:hypothetical protein